MARNRTDFIDRSIETLIARGMADPSYPGERAPLPVLNLSAPVADEDYREVRQIDSTSQRGPSTTHVIETPQGTVWLSGNVVMCGCPACDAPVSVRLWLMVADCWYCDSAIELGYEQQKAAEQLAEQIRPRDTIQPPAPRAWYRPQSSEPAVEFIETTEPESSRRMVDIIRSFSGNLPAWLISLLVHLIMLLILALILLPQDADFPTITLATAVGPQDTEGGTDINLDPDVPLEFDSDTPEDRDEIERELRRVEVEAAQDAEELLVDPDPQPDLPDLDSVRESLTTSPKAMTLAMRDPRLRNEIVRREGGTTLSEAAVSRGLRWLASVQNRDGSWSLGSYRDHDDPDNQGDMAATSLALLPFLGAGQTHEYGKYKKTVASGLKWLIEHQKSNGELMHGIRTNAAIYAHGQASIVLVEALAMTGDERFREPAQKAIDFIEAFQHKHGGWRYRRQEAGDTSVMGWQLMALQSARASNSGLLVRDATLLLADQYLDQASRDYSSRRFRDAPAGTLYRYQPPDRTPKPAMTAEGILCRMYLGWRRDDSRLLYAVDWLLENALPAERDDTHNFYYYYYATQVMHHFGGQHWEKWNDHLRDLLIVMQQRSGRYAGSWDPRDVTYGDSGGRIYATSLAICSLEVYYRHLPLFRKLDLE